MHYNTYKGANMGLEIESLIDTVITVGYLDYFTAREITIGLCCLAKIEHCDLIDTQKRVSEYLDKLADNDLLESTPVNNQSNVYKKTDEFHICAEPLDTATTLTALFIKECQSQRNNCALEISECGSAMSVHSKLCRDSSNLQELMKPAYLLIEERHNHFINKLKIIDQLLGIHNCEVHPV